MSCVVASFAPISLFFLLIGSSYTFMRLLHVGVFGIAGFAGMIALNRGLSYACEKYAVYPRKGVRVFKVWVLIFAFVGTQLAWNLRPFIGSRQLPFQLFRKHESNFYAHVLYTLRDFLTGEKKVEGRRSEKETGNIEKPPPKTENVKKLGRFDEIVDTGDTGGN